MSTYRDPSKTEDLADPLFNEAGRVHDWRNHVGDHAQAIWHTFTDEQRLAIAADAYNRANAEEWE